MEKEGKQVLFINTHCPRRTHKDKWGMLTNQHQQAPLLLWTQVRNMHNMQGWNKLMWERHTDYTTHSLVSWGSSSAFRCRSGTFQVQEKACWGRGHTRQWVAGSQDDLQMILALQLEEKVNVMLCTKHRMYSFVTNWHQVQAGHPPGTESSVLEWAQWWVAGGSCWAGSAAVLGGVLGTHHTTATSSAGRWW